MKQENLRPYLDRILYNRLRTMMLSEDAEKRAILKRIAEDAEIQFKTFQIQLRNDSPALCSNSYITAYVKNLPFLQKEISINCGTVELLVKYKKKLVNLKKITEPYEHE